MPERQGVPRQGEGGTCPDVLRRGEGWVVPGHPGVAAPWRGFRALSALSVENRVCDLRCGMLDGIGERKRAAAREPRGE